MTTKLYKKALGLVFFEHFQGVWLHNFPGQAFPMLKNASSEDIFPNIHPERSLAQLQAICP